MRFDRDAPNVVLLRPCAGCGERSLREDESGTIACWNPDCMLPFDQADLELPTRSRIHDQARTLFDDLVSMGKGSSNGGGE